MAITEAARAYHEKMFPGRRSAMLKTDPEFMERFYNFAYDEVVNQDDLDDHTRFMAILATLLGCQGVDEFRCQMGAALNFGVTPGGGQGDRLSGRGLPGYWPGIPLPGGGQ